MATDTQIDDAVIGYLVTAEGHWRKVAMVVWQAADALGGELPDGDAGYELVAKRIEALVASGRLLAQGDLSRWRHSEVRLPL